MAMVGNQVSTMEKSEFPRLFSEVHKSIQYGNRGIDVLNIETVNESKHTGQIFDLQVSLDGVEIDLNIVQQSSPVRNLIKTSPSRLIERVLVRLDWQNMSKYNAVDFAELER
jgi:hypothetical protein